MRKILLSVSAIFLGIAGIALSFFPQEVGMLFNGGSHGFTMTSLQILGACYLGFAFMNWTARRSVIGGIYNRPLVLGNFMHFFVGVFAWSKSFPHTGAALPVSIVALILYIAMALGFLILMRSSPVKKTES